MPDGVYMDPGELRRIAERVLGGREFDFRPKLDEIKEQLRTDSDDRFGSAVSSKKNGYIHGVSGIGEYHEKCVQEVSLLFEDADKGMIAFSNFFATLAESYVKTDGEAGSDMSSTMKYFSPEDTGTGIDEPGFPIPPVQP